VAVAALPWGQDAFVVRDNQSDDDDVLVVTESEFYDTPSWCAALVLLSSGGDFRLVAASCIE
jgi:hypothetical protein